MRFTVSLVFAGFAIVACGKNAQDTPGEQAPTTAPQPTEEIAPIRVELEPGLRTPLHVAAFKGDAEGVEQLIREGADVNARGPKLWTPLHETTKSGALRAAEVLIEHGSDPNARDERGWTALHMCFGEWDYRVKDVAARKTKLAELLIAKGADVNAVAKDGDAPLHNAAEKRHEPAVAMLLRAGAKVDARGRGGDTALRRAVERPDAVVKRLIDAGADINTKDDVGETPLHRVARHAFRLEALKLLVARGADVTARDEEGNTPLHMAAASGEVEAAKLLLAKGADVNAQRVDGRTPRSFACNANENEMIEFLTQNGAVKNLGRPTVEQVIKTNRMYGKPVFRLKGKAAGIWFAIDPILGFVEAFSGVDVLGFLIDEGIDEVIVWTHGGREGFTLAVPFTQGHAIEFNSDPDRGGNAHLMRKTAEAIAKDGIESSSARELLKMLFGPPPDAKEKVTEEELEQMYEQLAQRIRRVTQAPPPATTPSSGS